MITQLHEGEQQVFDYIGNDYGKCLYIYIDLRKYGFTNPNFKVWIQYDDHNNVSAIISRYYTGIQVYSKNGNFDAEEIAEFIRRQDVSGVFAVKETIDKLQSYFPDFLTELGTVGQLKKLAGPVNLSAYSAAPEELREVAELVAADEVIGKPYGFSSLYKQFTERKEQGFGRNFILREGQNNKIICHAGTYAELPKLAVIGGVIVAPPYRGKGYSKGVLAAICQELLTEGKDIFSFYYIPSANSMHTAVGFDKIATWAKLFKS